MRTKKYKINLNKVNANFPKENGVFMRIEEGNIIVGDVVNLIASVAVFRKHSLLLSTSGRKLALKYLRSTTATIHPMPNSTEEDRLKRIEEIKNILEGENE